MGILAAGEKERRGRGAGWHQADPRLSRPRGDRMRGCGEARDPPAATDESALACRTDSLVSPQGRLDVGGRQRKTHRHAILERLCRALTGVR